MTVWVLTPDFDWPVGGVQVHYRIVDALNEAGIPAAVVHSRRGFRCRWFENDTRVEYAGRARASSSDLLVFPEEWVEGVSTTAPGIPKVVFNQNAYSTFSWGLSVEENRECYRHPDVRGVVVVSQDNETFLRYALPELKIGRVRCMIDPQLFHPDEPKTRTIAYMPRKRRQEGKDVLALLGLRGVLDGWSVAPIDRVSHTTAAAMLRRAAVFLSFSHREGFGLPAAEAMAAGCVVVGFDGFGGREFFSPHGIPVSDGDVFGFARAVEEVLKHWETDHERYRSLTAQASKFVRSTYSPANHKADVVEVFGGFESKVGPVTGSVRLEMPRVRRVAKWRRAAWHVKGAMEALLGRD